MEWSDLKRLDMLIKQFASLGAGVEQIGVSGEGRSLRSVSIGDLNATRTVVIVAGLHAAEVIAPLAAIAILQAFIRNPLPKVRLCVVPVADPDLAFQNANKLPEAITLQALLNLNHQRDLEGHFSIDTYPECVAVRHWIEQFDRVDAYFSLHSAHCISPGLFFYVGSPSHPSWTKQAANVVTSLTPNWIPLLSQDPTGLSQEVLSPGFFEMKIPIDEPMNSTNPISSIAFVADRFQPQYLGVPEMPLAVCPALANTSLAEIDQCNRNFRTLGQASYPLREIPFNLQLHILQGWLWSVLEQVAAIA